MIKAILTISAWELARRGYNKYLAEHFNLFFAFVKTFLPKKKSDEA